jgi:hypothetical protein
MVKILSITYYITLNDTYAVKASELIGSWFLNEDTRMNPNFNYGELNRGIK